VTSPTDNPTGILRIDPCPSKVFSWIEFNPDSPAVLDDRGRTIQPAGPCITARYRTTGAEWCAWPCTEEIARRVMQPGAEFDYSSGRAWSQLVMPRLSKRLVKPGERQETVCQREAIEKQFGRRWLA
jgi:hypothetical protein